MGVETLARAEVEDGLDNDGQGALAPDDVFALGCQADHPDSQAVVLSCTDMRSVEAISRLEAHLGKPVITSNQAMMWATLRHLDVGAAPRGYGHLLERDAA